LRSVVVPAHAETTPHTTKKPEKKDKKKKDKKKKDKKKKEPTTTPTPNSTAPPEECFVCEGGVFNGETGSGPAFEARCVEGDGILIPAPPDQCLPRLPR
jgi:hypothetical protein